MLAYACCVFLRTLSMHLSVQKNVAFIPIYSYHNIALLLDVIQHSSSHLQNAEWSEETQGFG